MGTPKRVLALDKPLFHFILLFDLRVSVSFAWGRACVHRVHDFGLASAAKNRGVAPICRPTGTGSARTFHDDLGKGGPASGWILESPGLIGCGIGRGPLPFQNCLILDEPKVLKA